MPKVWAMTQISRPFQIALLAMGLFAAVWFFVLQGHSASTTGSGSSASAPSAPAQSGKATPQARPSRAPPPRSENATGCAEPVYHGSAPGVEGLTRAIDKAHGAVATSQQNAKALEEKSAQASSASFHRDPGRLDRGVQAHATVTRRPPTWSTAAHAGATHTVRCTRRRQRRKQGRLRRARPRRAARRRGPVPRMQATVEAELKQGKIVADSLLERRGIRRSGRAARTAPSSVTRSEASLRSTMRAPPRSDRSARSRGTCRSCRRPRS